MWKEHQTVAKASHNKGRLPSFNDSPGYVLQQKAKWGMVLGLLLYRILILECTPFDSTVIKYWLHIKWFIQNPGIKIFGLSYTNLVLNATNTNFIKVLK